MNGEVEIPKPPATALLTREQEEKLVIARALLEELWLEPEETGILQKILPWLVLSINLLTLLIVLFLKH
jgi:hypothetical protein